jgi:LysM repeat protein
VAVFGVGVLLRARAAIDGGSASSPGVAVVKPVPDEGTPAVAAPTAVPPVLPASPPPSPTGVVLSTPTSVPTASATPAPVVSLSPQVSVTVVVQEAAAAATPQAPVAEPEPTAVPEEIPPAPPAAPSRPASAYRIYVVQRGDILKEIAAHYGVSMASIVAINDIPNPDSLRVGQVLTIPPSGS